MLYQAAFLIFRKGCFFSNTMSNIQTILKTADVKPGKGTPVEIHGKRIAVYFYEGRYYAVADECLHRGAPLHEGVQDGRSITCPLHDWMFDITTGEQLNNLAAGNARLRTFDLIIENDEIKIDTAPFET